MFVYVDDTNPAVLYGRGWTASTRSGLLGGYGAPLYGTVHGSTGIATFSFSFSGTYMAVFLLSEFASSYNCTIDGMPFSPTASALRTLPSPKIINLSPEDMATCHGPVNDDGRPHELQVTISGSQSNPIFFDYLQYTPSEPVTSADLAFGRGDSSVVLGPTNPDTLGLLPGSTLDFTFVGYSATIRGAFDLKELSQPPSPVSYTIDGGDPVNFMISNPATNTTPFLNNQVLIQTPRYPFGKHVLHLEFLGTDDTVPFIPTDFIVQNGTSHIDLAAPVPSTTPPPFSISSSSSWPPHSSSSSSTPSLSHSGSHTAILGTALGTVVLIIVLLLAIVLVRRKSRVPGEYIPHHLLQETTVLPSSHNTRPSQHLPRKTTSRPSTGRNPQNRSASPVGVIVVHRDGGGREPQRKPENEIRTEEIDTLPRYETINDSIT